VSISDDVLKRGRARFQLGHGPVRPPEAGLGLSRLLFGNGEPELLVMRSDPMPEMGMDEGTVARAKARYLVEAHVSEGRSVSELAAGNSTISRPPAQPFACSSTTSRKPADRLGRVRLSE
jgi:hypothetical protein